MNSENKKKLGDTKKIESINKIVKDESKKKKINRNTQEYVDELLEKRNRNFKIIVTTIILLFVLIAILTGFALKTSVSNKIINGIFINGIDVSGLTTKQAEDKINNQIEKTKISELNLEYKDFNTIIERKDLNINFKIEDAVKKAYDIGRSDNIIYNNFKIIMAGIKKEKLKINIEYNEEMLSTIMDGIGKELPGLVREYAYCIEDDELIITSGKKGIKLDDNMFKNIVLDRFAGNIKEKNEKKVSIPVVEKEPDKIDINKIYNEIYSKPQNAYIKEDPLEIIVDKDGVDFKISIEEAQKIIDKEEKDEYIIPLKITKAKTTVKDLGTKAFPDRISIFTTKYDASNRNRSTNLELAASKINGTVLLPGDEFSYNKVVGKRTIENGYKEAAIYTNKGVEDGLGGGICQISSTLYNAVLLANLEIVERRNHGYTTSYCEAGRDATVVYGAIDFRFKNTREYPIKINASVKNGVATIKIMGIKQDTEYTVKIRAYKTKSIPYKVEKIKDDDLFKGEEKVKQKGANGCRAVCYRDLYLNGKKVSSELISTDTYKSMKRIVRIGTKNKPKEKEPEKPKPQEPSDLPENITNEVTNTNTNVTTTN